MHGLTVKSHTQGVWDWGSECEACTTTAATEAPERRAQPASERAAGGAGTLADGGGTGWNNLALKGIWRPGGIAASTSSTSACSRTSYTLRYLTSSIAGNWLDDAPARWQQRRGKTAAERCTAGRVGLRHAGRPCSACARSSGEPRRPDRVLATQRAELPVARETLPVAEGALSFQATRDLVLKASTGARCACRRSASSTGATSTTNSAFVNDPNLKPERSWTTELTAEKELGHGLLRLTAFTEDTHDAIYSQVTVEPAIAGPNKNVDAGAERRGASRTHGLELAYTGSGRVGEGPGPERQPDLRRFGDQGERRLRRDTGRHDRQAPAQHPEVARQRTPELPIRRTVDGGVRRTLQRRPVPDAEQRRRQRLSPTRASASTSRRPARALADRSTWSARSASTT
jgi:iron complex outermembrane receptor protein